MYDPIGLKEALLALGWSSPFNNVWQSLIENPPQVAILAPPYDTVPSQRGNAIYDIIELLAEKIDLPCIILSNTIKDQQIHKCPISHRILYYTRNFIRNPQDLLPFKLKKRLFGTSVPSQLSYPISASQVCELLAIKILMIEDQSIYCAYVKSHKKRHIFLHQHANTARSLTSHWWRRVFNNVDVMVSVSKRTLNDIDKLNGPIRIKHIVVYNGVDLEHYSAEKWRKEGVLTRENFAIPTTAQVLLFVGRIIPQKGPLEAALAFHRADVEDSHFLIVGSLDETLFGDRSYTEELKKLANSSEFIHLAGLVPQYQLPAYYAAANLTIVPSMQSEGTPKVLTESLAMGKPVIASDQGGTWELLNEEHNAWLIKDPRNIGELSSLLSVILSNPQDIQRRQQYILDHDREKMGIDHMVGKFEELYHQLLDD